MELLLDNPLATLYGPYFLILYGFVIFFAVSALAIAKLRLDQTDQLSLPPVPSVIDPFEIAFLRGGENELARSVVFSLIQKGHLEIDSDAKPNLVRRVAAGPSPVGLAPIEQLALGWYGASREPKEMFQKEGLIGHLANHSHFYQNKLEGQQFLVSGDDRDKLAWVKFSVMALIFLFGFYKFVAAIAHGYYNFVLLPIFLVAGLGAAYYAGRSKRTTKLGESFLVRLQTAFDGLKYSAQAGYLVGSERPAMPPAKFAGVDPLLLSVGVFGGAILAGTVFDSYNQAFHRSQLGTNGGSSCGGGCGSCSAGGSSCSSGDSGGSSCGGGCGGCGGGGD